MIKLIYGIDQSLEKLVKYLLVTNVFLMLFITVFSIVLRWFETSILWLDPLVRHLVFFSAFLGGIMATGSRKHICIDVIGLYLESKKLSRLRLWLQRITDLSVTFILIWLSRAGLDFVSMEKEFMRTIFLGLKNYQLVAIMPLGFSLMAFRFFNQFLFSFYKNELKKT